MLITLGPLHHFPRDGCLIVLHCIHSCLVVDQCINDIRYLAWMHLNTLYVELACPASTCGRLWPLSRWNLCGVTTSSMPQKGLHVLVRSWRCGRIPFLDVLQLFCSYFNVTLFCHCPPFADLRLSCLKQTNILRILDMEHFRASWQGCTACPSRWLDAQFPETRAVHCCAPSQSVSWGVWCEWKWCIEFYHFGILTFGIWLLPPQSSTHLLGSVAAVWLRALCVHLPCCTWFLAWLTSIVAL